MINLTIDGKHASVPPGATLLEAAQAVGVTIPTLCWLKKLSPIGSCRMCVVTVEGVRKPVTACDTVAGEGLVVTTDSPELREMRRDVLKLMLLKHPLDCPTCDKGGECDLQDLVFAHGIETQTFAVAPFTRELPQYPSPFIKQWADRCVLCGRCVRACKEIKGVGCIEIQGSGFHSHVGPVAGVECISCGECLSVCPVGALTDGVLEKKARVWEAKRVPTTCGYCGVGCQLELNVRNDTVLRVTTTQFDQGPNHGSLCVKGRFGWEFVNHPDRLKTPLVRKDGALVEATWDEALTLVATRFQEIKDAHGPDAIAGLASARCTNEDNYLFQKFFRGVIGTNNVDHSARRCHGASVAGLAASLGTGAMTNSIADLDEAQAFLVIGSNPTEDHPIVGDRVQRAVTQRGAKLILVDPRRVPVADYANVFLQVPPGHNVPILNALCHVIWHEGLHDAAFVAERCEGVEAFAAALEPFGPEAVEALTGVPAQSLREAARLYAAAKPASVLYCAGVTQHAQGTDAVKALANLALLTGNLGVAGGGVNPLAGQNNVQGCCDVGGLPSLFPGYQAVDDPAAAERLERAWGRKVPTKPGLTLWEATQGAHEGTLKAMYVMGENPALTAPGLPQVNEALERLDFLVVQDIFLTETAQKAHVVLPACSFAEKDGTFANTERRVQRVRAALPPRGQSRPDWRILQELSARMGLKTAYANASAVFDELASVTPSYAGLSYARLEQGGIQWPCPTPDHPGTPILHVGQFSRGKGLFHGIEFRGADEKADGAYPLLLTTGREHPHFHSGTMTRRCARINDCYPEGFMEVNPADAATLKLTTGDTVRVSSRRGEITTKVRVIDRTAPGTVFLSFHYSESPVNVLTNPALCPTAKIPEYKVCAVKVTKG